MDFEYKNGHLYCKRCGSGNVRVKPGMMTDLITCNDCGNEEYTQIKKIFRNVKFAGGGVV